MLQHADNITKIYKFLREVGLTHAGAVGMLANMYAESKCDPLCIEALLIQRYKEERFLKWDYGLYDENTYKQYWSYFDAGAISQEEFISPRQYTGAPHQYGAGICQWTSHSRKKKWISLAKDDNTKLTDLGLQLNLLYWELKNTYADVYRVLHSTINVQVATNYVLRNFEAPANAASHLPTRMKYATEIENYLKTDSSKSTGGATVKKASDLDADDWIVAVRAVAEYARVHGYTYGDSHATPPTADKKISCDRLVARALWDRGFTDQPVSTTSTSGITVGSMDKYLVNHGFEKGTSFSDIRKGSIVVVGDSVPRHTFVTVSYDSSTKTFVKYDCGSQARINTKQPFTEKWAYQKLFYVYNIPKKAQNGGGTVSAFSPDKVIQIAKNEAGYLEKRSNAQLDSKTGNAGKGNYTKYWRDLKPSFQGEAWCDCFVDWCFFKAYGKTDAQKLECGGFGEFYTPTSAQCYKDAGRYDKTPKIGDQIFFKNSSRICHTGIVYAVANGKVYTIEGNTSGGSEVIPNGGGVCMKSYAVGNSRIAGYGHPRYNASATVNTPTASTPTTHTSNGTVSGYMFQPKTVILGSKGNSVLLLQEILYARKLYTGKLTGVADATLVNAINAYQDQRRKDDGTDLGTNGRNDGACGKKMWADIIAL